MTIVARACERPVIRHPRREHAHAHPNILFVNMHIPILTMHILILNMHILISNMHILVLDMHMHIASCKGYLAGSLHLALVIYITSRVVSYLIYPHDILSHWQEACTYVLN